ncbi:MAG TPA: RnfABCDGE type electron transport complex subunit D [Phycisphaerae bacterium]|nr:RnfABCDGE type electron transport complex subunit D [Phycisphaerae bacterium]HPM23850.1 RnfABCDGE type electron transport complex subunit D [Phycisphaerae bacterium]
MSDAVQASGTPLPVAPQKPEAARGFLVSPAPHLSDSATTRRIMFEVLLALVPLFVVALWNFRLNALWLTLVTTAGCLAAEAVANWMRGRTQSSLGDGSALVTGVILAFSLPPGLRLYQAFIGGVVAIGLGKMVFGGLGQNLFNPAMVGRAFLMVCFPVALTTWMEPGTLRAIGDVDAVTRATPLAAAKYGSDVLASVANLFFGRVAGCVGETSALAALIGGLYLVIRKVADWRPALGMLLAAAVFAFIAAGGAIGHRFQVVEYQLLSGALVFGAFFIATDYVGAPVTPCGRWIFGLGAGVLVMLIRLYGGYPEGVMYAILIMNALTPLIERWTLPTPFGGKVPA